MEWWQSALITIAGTGVASYVGVRAAIVRLETQMTDVREWVRTLRERTHDHNDAILIHDAELEELMRKVGVTRMPRRRK
jgi:hypothetical protein